MLLLSMAVAGSGQRHQLMYSAGKMEPKVYRPYPDEALAPWLGGCDPGTYAYSYEFGAQRG